MLLAFKKSITKIAIEEYLKRKEDAQTEEEYQSLLIELSKILFKIDHSEDCDQLTSDFTNEKFPLLGTEEHRNAFNNDVEKYAKKLLRYT